MTARGVRVSTLSRWSIILCTVLAGCVRSVPRPAPAAYAAPVAERVLDEVHGRDRELLDYGLQPLPLAALPEGHRELRLWPSSGPGSIPRLFVRVVDPAGVGATAEWVAFWPANSWGEGDEQRGRAFRRRMRRERRCGPIRRVRETEFCQLAVITGPRAAALVTRLDSAGVWPLPDPQHPPTPPGRIYVQIDGRGVVAEAREGDGYQRRSFGERDIRADRAIAYLYRFAYSGGT